MKMLEVENLKISVPAEKVVLVNNSSFKVEKGKSLIILGQSGSGKTLTCEALTGVLDGHRYKAEGEILFMGESILNMSERNKRKLYGDRIAIIPQNPMTAFDPSYRVGKQLFETLRVHKKCGKEEIATIYNSMKAAGLDDVERVYRSYPYELSGGMLQRLTIAMALMLDVKLVIADEPTTALDVQHRNETVDVFIKLRNMGITIILITHDFSVARQFGGEILVMKDGEIIEKNEMTKIMNNPQHEYVKELINASRLNGKKDNRGEGVA